MLLVNYDILSIWRKVLARWHKMRTIEGKVVVLGAQGVGKTSMVVRYVGKMFSHHISPTIGASFFTCRLNVEDTRVKLQFVDVGSVADVLEICTASETSITLPTSTRCKDPREESVLTVWDTAGQERFRSMAPMYYRNANAAIIVFDITQYDTFDAMKTWVKELQRHVLEPMVLSVVGNKTDLESQRQVTRDEAVQYAASIGGNYFESSAVHDEGIEDVFLSTAIGLIRLAQDSLCSSMRICDLTDPMSPVSNVGNGPSMQGDGSGQNHNSVQMTSVAHAEVERTGMCC